eukprot:scaffold1243_cov173-Ochromonas_danica.AAC.3
MERGKELESNHIESAGGNRVVVIPSGSSAFVRAAENPSPGQDDTKDSFTRSESNSLYSFTIGIAATYKKCNASFKAIEVLPQRILTHPSEGVSNNGCDNQDANLICRVHDKLISTPSSSSGQEKVYTILDLLGTGTFGQVFRCKREDTKELFAVKVIKNKPAYHTQGMLEIKIAKLLNAQYDPQNEKHIVRLLESFEYRGHICVVFELLSMSLLDLLTQNQFRGLPLSIVQRFAKQILSALMALEEANVIHCDLKPENILLLPAKHKALQRKKVPDIVSPSEGQSGKESNPKETVSQDLEEKKQVAAPSSTSSSSGTSGSGSKKSSSISDIKVIDFGSACFEGRTVYSYIQSHRSPEVLLGAPYTGAIDVWSLACVCAEMYLGLPLFPGVSQHNQLARIVEMFGVPPDFLIECKHGLKYFTPVQAAPANEKDASAHKPGALLATTGARYRLKTAEEYAAETNTEVPVLKKYLRYSNLEDVILRCPLPQKSRMTTEQRNSEMLRRRSFLDFLQGLFRLNPFERWTAKQAAQHPFIQNVAFTGPFHPKPDLKTQERKLMYMVQMQQRQTTFQDESANKQYAGLKGLRTPTNFALHTAGAQPTFTPLQYSHRRLSEPTDSTTANAGLSSKPISLSERPVLKRGDPVHVKAVEADTANSDESVASHNSSAEVVASTSEKPLIKDQMTGISQTLSKSSSADEQFTKANMSGPPALSPVPLTDSPLPKTEENTGNGAASPGVVVSGASQQPRTTSGAGGAKINNNPSKPRTRHSFTSQPPNWVKTATDNVARQQHGMQAQSFNVPNMMPPHPPLGHWQQHQPQQSMPPPVQQSFPMPLMGGQPQPTYVQAPPAWPYGIPNIAPNMANVGMIPQAMPFYPAPGNTMGGMEFYGPPQQAMAASYGPSSFGMFPGTSSSIPEGGNIVMTDFGMALLRPDMDEQRLLLSQNPGMMPGYWRPMPGSFLPFSPDQMQAQMMNMNSVNEAAARYNYAMQAGHYASFGPNGPIPGPPMNNNNVQMARSFDSTKMVYRNNHPPNVRHNHVPADSHNRGQQQQRRRSGGRIVFENYLIVCV